MMSEMYQVHQCVVLNLSLYLISKTICSTQVQLSSLGKAQVGAGIFDPFGPEIPVRAESPPLVDLTHIKGVGLRVPWLFPHSTPAALTPN